MQLLVLALVIGGISEGDVILANKTGIAIARIEIDNRVLQTIDSREDKILVEVTPEKHHLKIVFRGGAKVDWPHFDFEGVHEIFFEREHNKIHARVE